jgi:hypothetical protein
MPTTAGKDKKIGEIMLRILIFKFILESKIRMIPKGNIRMDMNMKNIVQLIRTANKIKNKPKIYFQSNFIRYYRQCYSMSRFSVIKNHC